jgi:rRNA metabolism SBDS family protein
MTQTTARIRKGANSFEILVDLDEALKVRKGEGNISSAVLTDSVFHNLKSGEHASKDVLEIEFGTGDFYEICSKIIKSGEVVLPTEYINERSEQKYKQVVDFLVKNAVSPEGRPYTPDRIMSALKEARIEVKNKPVESQIKEIVEHLQKVIPLKMETKRIRITIPAQHTGKAYGIVNEFKEEEEWLSNGDLVIVIKIPAGMVMDFYDKLNSCTHGSSLAEEIK